MAGYRAIRVSTVLLFFISSHWYATLGAAELQRVSWEDLPERVSELLVPVNQLGIVECPAGLDESQPSRTVLQYIENTFYKWHEYDLGKAGFCIVMERPKRQQLTSGEAQVLLSASRLWAIAEPDPADEIRLAPDDPDLDLPTTYRFLDDGGPRPEVVIGADERTLVDDTTVFPYNGVCYLSNQYSDGSRYRGTGAVVGPYMVLTCGHNLYDPTEGGYADSAFVSPGQYQLGDGTVIRPYGTATAAEVHVAALYPSNIGTANEWDYDYGSVLYETPFAPITTYMPLLFNHTPTGLVKLVGYPATAQSVSTQDMWEHNGGVYSVSARVLRYTADTSGGNSGGPVWSPATGLPGDHRIVAIHTFGSSSYNGGPRLVSANQAEIEQWMLWRPVLSDDAYEENDTPLTSWYPGQNWERLWLSSISGQGVQADDDWYEIDVDINYQRVVVDCRFSTANGNIDLALFSSSGIPLASATSQSNDELIVAFVPGPGKYYIRVYGANASNSYDLWWDDTPTYINDTFESTEEGWTWFDESPNFEAPAHAWSGGALLATETDSDQLVFGSWESTKNPATAMHPTPGQVYRVRYQLRSSVDGVTCPGFRFRAATTHAFESTPGVWQPDFGDPDINSTFELFYSTLNVFHIPGREPGTAGQTYTLLYYPEQTSSLYDYDVVIYFTFDLLDLEGPTETDAGTLSLEQVDIDSFSRPTQGTGTAVPGMTYSNFLSWQGGKQQIGTPYNDAGLTVFPGATGISITVASGNQWFEAYALSPVSRLTSGKYYRTIMTVASTGIPVNHIAPTVRAGFASSHFVFGANKQLAGGGTLARFGIAPQPFEIWTVAPTAEPGIPGLTEPIHLRFESWLGENAATWPLYKEVAGTVTLSNVVTEAFDPF